MAKYYEERSLTLRILVTPGITDEELLSHLKSGNTEQERVFTKEAINALERGEKTIAIEDENPRDTKGRFIKKKKKKKKEVGE